MTALPLAWCGLVLAVETLTDPGVALSMLQSAQGGAWKLEFDGVLPLAETVRITSDTTIDASGHEVALDAGQRCRHFLVSPGVTLRLIHVTLSHGLAEGDHLEPAGTPGSGGAIYNAGGLLELVDCTFTQNQALGAAAVAPEPGGPGAFEAGPRGGTARGGAIYSAHGRLAITNCVFAGNATSGGTGAASLGGYTGGGGDSFGGAVYSTNADSILVGVTFTNNLARGGEMSPGRAWEGGGGAYGGAVAVEAGILAVQNCVFTGNQAWGATRVGTDASRATGTAQGGALFRRGGEGVIRESSFENNLGRGGLGAERGGHAILFGDAQGGAIDSGGPLEIRQSTFVANTARGGDVPSDCCSPFLAQAGAGQGGAIASQDDLVLVNCTLTENLAAGGQASSGGAFSGAASGGAMAVSAGSVALLNLTVAANRADASNVRKASGSSIFVGPGVVSCTNTILLCAPGLTNVAGRITDGGHNLCSDDSAQFTLPSSRSNLDAQLGPLLHRGGPTRTMALLPSSPAIDQGDDAAAPPVDQRGVRRPMAGASDIGAFELVPQLSVSLAEGRVQLSYAFRAEHSCQIRASANLLDWVLLGRVTSGADGALRFEEAVSPGLQFRFYTVSE